MPQVGFDIAIPVFERAETIHALERAATVIGFKEPQGVIYEMRGLFIATVSIKRASTPEYKYMKTVG
jgi:hypothetical protein